MNPAYNSRSMQRTLALVLLLASTTALRAQLDPSWRPLEHEQKR
jgi:hypothetical protein